MNATALNPMANEEEPGYIPTVEVIALVRRHRPLECLRETVANRGQYRVNDLLFKAMTVEDTCREILDANRWMMPG